MVRGIDNELGQQQTSIWQHLAQGSFVGARTQVLALALVPKPQLLGIALLLVSGCRSDKVPGLPARCSDQLPGSQLSGTAVSPASQVLAQIKSRSLGSLFQPKCQNLRSS